MRQGIAVDGWLFFAVAALLAVGITMVLSTSYLYSQERFSDGTYFFRKQLMAVGVGLLWVQAAATGGDNTLNSLRQIVGETSYGARWLQRQGLLAELVIAAWILTRTRFPKRVSGARLIELAVVALPTLALVMLQARNSHAAGLEDTSLLKVSLDALHLLAASLWSGGVMALGVTVIPRLRKSLNELALAWAVLRRFGGLAALSVGVLFATGLYNSGQQVASLDALLVTLYGQSLLVKVSLTLGVGLIGLLTSALLHPSLASALGRVLRRSADWLPFAPDRLKLMVTIEALTAGGVLLLAALLTATPPARGPEFEPPAPPETAPPKLRACPAAGPRPGRISGWSKGSR